MDGHALINQDKDVVKTDSQETLKNLQVKRPFFSVVYEDKGMKFCTQFPGTCVHKYFVLDFHLFA